jgi:DNA polymerase-4
LHGLGVRTVGQLAGLPEQILVDRFGTPGRHLWALAHGRDERAVVPDREAKSLSTETTFAHDVGDRAALRVLLLGLVDHLAGRLRQQGLYAAGVEVKVRSADFRTRIRSQALPAATDRTALLWQAAAALLGGSLSRDVLPVRLLGVGATRLVRAGDVQGQLFDGEQGERETALDRAVDAIRGQFGREAIQRGSLVDPPEEEDQSDPGE